MIRRREASDGAGARTAFRVRVFQIRQFFDWEGDQDMEHVPQQGLRGRRLTAKLTNDGETGRAR